ncbi:MAG: hypothetical protein JOZ47_14100 [Kutzneria sp.]|nr:hypothetical protein [Kutzneria sp.]MBV9846184.1 hypothetical protein [Kutzneria sp.]
MVDTTSSLSERLAEAEQGERPLAEEVNRLAAAKDDAVARSDYTAVGELQPQLDASRQELAIAHATTEALRGALAAIAEQRAADQQQLNLQRQRDQARAQYEAAVLAEHDALDQTQRHMAAVRAGLDAVRQSIEAALDAERLAGDARFDAHQALVQLGEREPAHVGRPNAASAKIHNDPLLSAIWRYRP